MWRTDFQNLSEKYINLVLSFPNLVLKACTILYMVYPYLFYCNIVWASTYKTNLLLTCSSCDSTKVRDQKYNKSAFDASFDPIYKEHRRLKLLGKFMYSYKHSLLPIRFRNTFPLIIRLITTIQEMLLLSSYPSVEQTLDNFLQAIRRGS